jgi:DNA replicative helicase MCM subunit Mcm2 (Cdc46/Mcm family)
MSELFKIVHNGETGEIQQIVLTENEIKLFKEEESKELAKKVQENSEKATKLAAKLELLEKLGITEDEAKLLLS